MSSSLSALAFIVSCDAAAFAALKTASAVHADVAATPPPLVFCIQHLTQRAPGLDCALRGRRASGKDRRGLADVRKVGGEILQNALRVFLPAATKASKAQAASATAPLPRALQLVNALLESQQAQVRMEVLAPFSSEFNLSAVRGSRGRGGGAGEKSKRPMLHAVIPCSTRVPSHVRPNADDEDTMTSPCFALYAGSDSSEVASKKMAELELRSLGRTRRDLITTTVAPIEAACVSLLWAEVQELSMQCNAGAQTTTAGKGHGTKLVQAMLRCVKQMLTSCVAFCGYPHAVRAIVKLVRDGIVSLLEGEATDDKFAEVEQPCTGRGYGRGRGRGRGRGATRTVTSDSAEGLELPKVVVTALNDVLRAAASGTVNTARCSAERLVFVEALGLAVLKPESAMILNTCEHLLRVASRCCDSEKTGSVAKDALLVALGLRISEQAEATSRFDAGLVTKVFPKLVMACGPSSAHTIRDLLGLTIERAWKTLEPLCPVTSNVLRAAIEKRIAFDTSVSVEQTAMLRALLGTADLPTEPAEDVQPGDDEQNEENLSEEEEEGHPNSTATADHHPEDHDDMVRVSSSL